MAASKATIESATVNELQQKGRFERIVLGLENEDNASSAIKLANALAQRFGASVFAVHSLSSASTYGEYETMSPSIFEQTLALSRKRIAAMVTSALGTVPLQWNISATRSDPALAILDMARNQKADLIIVGCHGRHGFDQLIFGSVSESLLNRAECPVLTIGPEFRGGRVAWKNVLFASDLDQTGIAGAEYAASIAVDNLGKLMLLHVVREKPEPQGGKRAWVEDNIRTHLERLFSPAALADCSHETLVSYGNPAEEILALAELKHADLIVLGTGNHKSVSDHAPWRTITQVLRYARCPVLNVAARCR